MVATPHDAKVPLLDSLGSGSRFDFYASCVAAVIAVVVGAMIWADVSFLDLGRDERAALGEPIATISISRNVVRTKSGALPLWSIAAAQDSLRASDYVFTDQDSSAKLKFVDQDVIELGQNTLIQVQRFENETSLGLLKGTLRTESKGQAKPLVIRLGRNGAVLRATAGSRLNIHADADGKADVSVLSGQAEMTQDQERIVLEAAQSATQSSDGALEKARELSAVLATPEHGANIVLSADEELTFSWSWAGAEAAWFELARDGDFSDLVTSEQAATDHIALKNIAPAEYYWRVRTGGVSEERRFTIARRTPPILLWPEDGVVLQQVAASMMLLWKGDAARHDVEIASSTDFSEPVFSATKASSPLATPVLSAGTYYWRVKESTESKGEWSSQARFTIGAPAEESTSSPTKTDESEEVLPPPDLNDQYEIEVPGAKEGAFLWERLIGMGTVYAAEGEVPVMRWPAIKEASAYAIQISDRDSFKTILRDQDVLSPLFTFEGFRPGTYYLRIATRNAKGAKGAYSKPVKVVISIPAPRLVAPAQDATFLSEAGIAFDWRRVEGSKGYRLEIARDSDFKAIVRTEYPSLSSLEVKGAEPGSYFWRVSAVFKDGQVSKPSPTARFTVTAPRVEVASSVQVPAPLPMPEPAPSIPMPASELVASAPPAPSHWSLTAGAAPTQFSYHGGQHEPDLAIRATLYNSFYAKGRFTINPRWDLAFFARRLATELFSADEPTATGQQPVKIAPLTTSVAAVARLWGLNEPTWLGLRGGLTRHTFLGFSQGASGEVAVEQTDLLDPFLGLTGERLLSQNWYLVGVLEYSVVMKNQRAAVASGANLIADLSLVQNFSESKTFAQYGYRWERARTVLTANAKDGHVAQDEGSLLLGLGIQL